MIHFHPYNLTPRQVGISSFYRWESWGPERLSNLLKITQLPSSRARPQTLSPKPVGLCMTLFTPVGHFSLDFRLLGSDECLVAMGPGCIPVSQLQQWTETCPPRPLPGDERSHALALPGPKPWLKARTAAASSEGIKELPPLEARSSSSFS